MVNTYEVWNKIIAGLNSISTKYLFIKANTLHNLPPYPYATVNILSPYIKDKDDFKGTITHSANDIGGITVQRLEEPQITFSLTFYSDNMAQVFQMIKDTMDWLQMQGKQYLSGNDIILLECSKYVNKTTILETAYVNKYGFDIRVRVKDIVTMDIDVIDSVSIENKNINETFNM